MEENLIYSYHIFLFPFKWEIDAIGNINDACLNDKCDLNLLRESVPTTWKKFQFRIEPSGSGNPYNEFSYFYEHVRPILALNIKNNSDLENPFSYQFSYPLDLNSSPTYTIKILNQTNPIDLLIDEITLNIYDTGIGIVSFFLKNQTISDFDIILKINEYGRRIYPQFLDQSDATESNINGLVTGTKYNFLADTITLKNIDKDLSEIKEDFLDYNSFKKIEGIPLRLPAHIQTLLGDKFKTKYQNANKGEVIVTPIIDDRMFVMSFINNSDVIKNLSRYNDAKDFYEFQKSEEWYRYIFVDDSTASCANKKMLQTQIEECTYARWIAKTNEDGSEPQGSLWGASRYSFVVLVANTWFNRVHLLNHFKTLYFQLVLLSITQRASILSFTDEASRIALSIKNVHSLKELSIRQVSNLQQSFLVFKSKINIHEVTAQEQGIELYNLIRQKMNINEQAAYLQDMIQSINEYVNLISENKRNEEAQNLTWIAALFLPASFIASMLGISFISGDLDFRDAIKTKTWLAWSIIIILGGIVSFIFLKIYKKK